MNNPPASADQNAKKPRRRFFGFRKKTNRSRNVVSSDQSDAYSRATAPPQVSTQVNPATLPKPKVISRTTSPEASPRTSAVATKAESGWLFRSKRFQKLCDNVFDAVDTDGSGSIDEKELYAGLLLIHLKLGAYAGPAACRPLGRERCHAVFVELDTDDSGHLDREEFRMVMIFLFGNVITRVLVQWSMTLLIVPLVAQYILDGIYWIKDALYDFVTTLDEDYWIADKVELFLESIWAMILVRTPNFVLSAAAATGKYLDMVPDAVWNSIPLTLLSTILGVLVVPYIIFSIDEFFSKAATKAKSSEIAKETKKKGP